MESEQERLRVDEMREWLQAWVERTSQRRVAEALGVNRDPLRRALRGTGEVTGVVRDAVESYARAHGIQIIDPDTSSSIGKDGADGVSGDDAESDANEGREGDNAPAKERSGNGLTGVEADGERAELHAQNDDETPDSPEHARHAPKDCAGEGVSSAGERSRQPGAARQPRDDVRHQEVSRLLGKIEDALTPAELASVVGAPVLAELPMEAALSGARALARGWRWVRDPVPNGLHGDALYYLHTREEVSFADEGAKLVAFAPDTEMFECGLTGAELRYGVHPRRRQKRYAVERHEDRGLLIGKRMAALVPEKPYPDEEWFFGSEGQAIDGEWYPGAAEIISARRKLIVMSDSFSDDASGKRLTPWQLALRNEQMRVELQLVNSHYALTIGEHVNGDRTWAPSTRLGIETRWRRAEIDTNEAMIQHELRRRRRLNALLWLPRLILRRIRGSRRKMELRGDVCGETDWSSTTPPSCVAAPVSPVSPPSTSTTSCGAPPSDSARAASPPSPSPASTSPPWDLKGKLLEQPVYRLLGGPCRDKVDIYVTSDDLEGHIELRKAINWVPLAAGEDHHGRHAFRQLIERRAIDIAQPDLKWCGGLTEAIKIHTIAEVACIATIPHAGAGTPYGQHFALAMPESPMAEFWMGSDPGVPLEEVCPIPGMPMPKDGYVTPSDAPGFGMEIMDEWITPWDHTAAIKTLK